MRKSLLKNIFLSLALFWASLPLIGNSLVNISGNAKGHEGSTIFLMMYSDLYTKTLSQAASTSIDDDGNFVLSAEINEIEYVCLRFDHLNAFLYLQPGKNYSLQMLPLNERQSVSMNNKTKVSYLFTSLDDDDINKHIIEFNTDHDIFFDQNYELLKKMAAPPGSHFQRKLKGDSIQLKPSLRGLSNQQKLAKEVSAFAQAMDIKYKDVDNEFFHVHRKMVVADLHLQLKGTEKTLYDTYLKSTAYHPKCPEYVGFTRSFYDKYFANYMFKWNDQTLIDNLNKGDVEGVMSLLKKDDFIANEEMRQFVLCHAIYETMNSKQLKKEGSYSILDQIAESGINKSIKDLARAVKRKMTKTQKGFPAYDLALPNHLQEVIKLSDFKGKHVLISFFNDRCSECPSELSIISQMHDKYKKHVEFISIGLDFKNEKMSDFLARNRDFKWTFLDGSQDGSLSEEFDIYSLPTFMLIDPNGNFVNAYAKKPSEGLEETVYSIFQKKETERKGKRRVGRK
ncbi:MAG: TlpA family protein disulfide reductase [Flavobacteriales bacterium]|nr:TlpA family protein disulfide reductase [Flavobacteriales bacterium]